MRQVALEKQEKQIKLHLSILVMSHISLVSLILNVLPLSVNLITKLCIHVFKADI